MLGLGLSLASIAQSLLSTLPPRANIVDIEQNEADIQHFVRVAVDSMAAHPSLDVLETMKRRLGPWRPREIRVCRDGGEPARC